MRLYPFCCIIGKRFLSSFGDNNFIMARLLDIVSIESSSAVVKVEVLSVWDELAFVRRLSAGKRKDLENRDYAYDIASSSSFSRIKQVTDRIICCYYSMGGGDITFSDSIFTDDDGIDHVFKTKYDDYHNRQVFYGDTVLGLHTKSPFRFNEKRPYFRCSD